MRLPVFNRWFTFVAGVLMCIVSGTAYLVGVFAPSIKHSLKYTESEINTVTTLGNFGLYLSVVNGFLLDFAGPRGTALFGGCFAFVGYFCFYLGSKGVVSHHYFAMGVYLALMLLGSNAIYLAAIGANLGNFTAKSRGKVSGVLAAGLGVSSAVFTQLYAVAFKPNVFDFLLFLAVTLGATAVVGTVFLNKVPILAPVAKPTEEAPLIQQPNDTNEYLESAPVPPPPKPQYNPLQLVITVDFWLLFIAQMTPIGAGLMIINIIGSIVLSLGGTTGSQDPYIIVMSISNCVGRFCVGLLSDAVARWMNRPFLNGVVIATLALAQLFLAFVKSRALLYVGVVAVGFTYGGLWAIFPVLPRELYGDKYWGINYSVLCLGPPIMTYIFSVQVGARIYEHFSAPNSNYCYGNHCFRMLFLITAGACMLSALFSVVLSLRTRGVHAKAQRK